VLEAEALKSYSRSSLRRRYDLLDRDLGKKVLTFCRASFGIDMIGKSHQSLSGCLVFWKKRL
jgi:hypothetical protein